MSQMAALLSDTSFVSIDKRLATALVKHILYRPICGKERGLSSTTLVAQQLSFYDRTIRYGVFKAGLDVFKFTSLRCDHYFLYNTYQYCRLGQSKAELNASYLIFHRYEVIPFLAAIILSLLGI